MTGHIRLLSFYRFAWLTNKKKKKKSNSEFICGSNSGSTPDFFFFWFDQHAPHVSDVLVIIRIQLILEMNHLK